MKVRLAVLMKSFQWENLYLDFTEIKVKCGGLWEYLTMIRNDRGGGEVGEEKEEKREREGREREKVIMKKEAERRKGKGSWRRGGESREAGKGEGEGRRWRMLSL